MTSLIDSGVFTAFDTEPLSRDYNELPLSDSESSDSSDKPEVPIKTGSSGWDSTEVMPTPFSAGFGKSKINDQIPY